MKYINDDVRAAISEHDVRANDHPIAIGRRRWQPAIQIHRHRIHVALHFRCEGSLNDELPFETRRQAVFLRQSRRKMPVVGSIPAANFVAVVFGKAVTAAIVVIVMIAMLVAPVAVVVMIVVILIVMVGISPRAGDGKACGDN